MTDEVRRYLIRRTLRNTCATVIFGLPMIGSFLPTGGRLEGFLFAVWLLCMAGAFIFHDED